jgi:putative oxygen-independent coproporphyrinogen III oxidase
MDNVTPALRHAKEPEEAGPPFYPAASHPGAEVQRGLGVYVHFPWCLKKCPYCDFLSIAKPREDVPHTEYATAVIAELQARAADLGPRPLVSVFFGGGTPSLWQPSELGRVLAAIRATFPDSTEVEVTAECNPSSLDYDRARALRDVGVNRLSIGVQSLDNEGLRFLGRLHSADEGLASVQAALAAGVPQVSADLIFGLPTQSTEAAMAQAQRVAELGVAHLSAYALTIEPQTLFGALHKKGQLPMAPEQTVADSFIALGEVLRGQAFEHYEISNYARAGQYAQHNLGYWQGRDYVGLGCGAWGTLGIGTERFRYRNSPRAERYIALCERLGRGDPELRVYPQRNAVGEAFESELELLSPEVMLSEALLLGLRLAAGVDIEAHAARLGTEAWTTARTRAVRRLVAKEQLVREGGRLRIPESAWLFADGIIAQLL